MEGASRNLLRYQVRFGSESTFGLPRKCLLVVATTEMNMLSTEKLGSDNTEQ